MSDESRQLVLHTSLLRPVLWGGADRRLVVPLWTLVILLVLGTPTHPLTLSVALLLGIGGHAALVRAAKADPYWFDIYWRTLRYQAFYPAQSSVKTPPCRVFPSVPRP